MNFIRKSLDALAGGDDKIYVIIDDREDVWSQDNGQVSANLLKIPPYLYYDNQREDLAKLTWFELQLRKCSQAFDLDITLLVYLKHLQKIHKLYFNSSQASDYNLDVKFFIN